MNDIDWYAILDDVGADADAEQYVTMPAASRLLLMEMATSFYGRYNRSGRAEPKEMYEYLSTAQKALARETNVINPYEKAWSIGTAINTIKMFPGLVGLWPMSVTNNIGQAIDCSGNGIHLIQNGVTRPKFGPVGAFLDGYYSNFFSTADNANLDITGYEQHIPPGLCGITVGTWVKFSSVTGTPGIITKWSSAGDNRSYALTLISSSPVFQVSASGAAVTCSSVHNSMVESGVWYFLCGSFGVSNSISVWLNDNKQTSSANIPPAIYNGNSIFSIGSFGNPTAYLSGNVLLSFVCSSLLNDDDILNYYHYSRAMVNG